MPPFCRSVAARRRTFSVAVAASACIFLAVALAAASGERRDVGGTADAGERRLRGATPPDAAAVPPFWVSTAPSVRSIGSIGAGPLPALLQAQLLAAALVVSAPSASFAESFLVTATGEPLSSLPLQSISPKLQLGPAAARAQEEEAQAFEEEDEEREERSKAETARQTDDTDEATFSTLLELVDVGVVTRVDIFDDAKQVVAEIDFSDDDEEIGDPQQLVVDLPGTDGTTSVLVNKLVEKGATISVHKSNRGPIKLHKKDTSATRPTTTRPAGTSTQDVLFIVSWQIAIPFLMTGTALFFLRTTHPAFRQRAGYSADIVPKTGVTFEHVAGIDECKSELLEIVDFLKDPARFVRVGARAPRGVLLEGPPGTGKTLMAKAMAGELQIPFIRCSGAEFVEVYVGVGARRVRRMFEEAKKHPRSIIFIDEIDALGKKRSGREKSKAGQEREQTLNQLLTEMDGMDTAGNFIVIAATNRADDLDSALIRPGRFDRRIRVGLPSLAGREQILRVSAEGKSLAATANISAMARRTSGFSGAQLANLMNEAAIMAVRHGKTSVGQDELDMALDRVVAGLPGRPLHMSVLKKVAAYHEAGHALVGTLLPHHEPVHKVSLVPRGQNPGKTWFMPNEDDSLVTLNAMKARIAAALGGRAAEEVVFGPGGVTSGARDDLAQVEGLARAMVTQFGMSDIGSVSLVRAGAPSEKLMAAVDKAIHTISDECYQTALEHVRRYRSCLDSIVDELLETETISGSRLREIVSEHAEIPNRMSVV